VHTILLDQTLKYSILYVVSVTKESKLMFWYSWYDVHVTVWYVGISAHSKAILGVVHKWCCTL